MRISDWSSDVCSSDLIQSGNVLFESDEPQASLEDRIEAALEGRFGFPILVVVRSHRQLRAVVQKAPEGFGQQPDLYHSDRSEERRGGKECVSTCSSRRSTNH